RDELAGQGERLEEGGGTRTCHQQRAGRRRYPPRDPKGDEERRHDGRCGGGRRHATDDPRRAPVKVKDRPEDQYQPLWAVDPHVSVEGVGALPQPGRLGIPPLVGRERRAPEREAEEHRERRRRQRHERWGSPCAGVDRRSAVAAGLALTATFALAIVLFGLSLTADRYLLVLLVPALVLRRGRLYLRDFGSFAVLMLVYGEMRGLAHVLHPSPYYLPQLRLERWLFGGYVPTVELQHWWWTGTLHWWDKLLFDVAKLHFVVPPLFAFGLWLRRRALFFRCASSMLVLSFASALVFLLYPAAPPWAAGRTL